MTATYVTIGGFLGAGKTTAMLRLAELLSARGLRVGLITNDQSRGLVDTGTMAPPVASPCARSPTDASAAASSR